MWSNLRVNFFSILSSFSLRVIRGQIRLATLSNLLFLLQTHITTSTVSMFLRFVKWNHCLVYSFYLFQKDHDPSLLIGFWSYSGYVFSSLWKFFWSLIQEIWNCVFALRKNGTIDPYIIDIKISDYIHTR